MKVLTITHTAVTVLLIILCRMPARAQSQPLAPVESLRLTLDDALARGVASSHRLEEATARHDGVG